MNLQQAALAEPVFDYHGLLEVLADFEARHDVVDWQMFGWQIWPICRIMIATDALMRAAGARPVRRSSGGSNKSGLWQKAVSYAGLSANWARAQRYHAPACRARTFGRTDVLVVGQISKMAEIGGRDVCFNVQPVIDQLRQSGMRCRLWLDGHADDYDDPDWLPVADVMPFDVRRRLKRDDARPMDYPAPWFRDLVALQQHLGAAVSTWHGLQHAMRLIAAQRDFAGEQLDKCRPKVVIVSCWYDWLQAAVSLAAHERGIAVIDIQHGTQECGHYGYCGWTHAPERGWPVMPDVFWTWGTRASDLINATNRIPVTALVGGNPWLNQWRNATSPAIDRHRADVRALAGQTPVLVLATLSNIHDLALDRMEDAMRSSPDDWVWLVRLHPSTPGRRGEVEARLAGASCKVIVETADTRPLQAILAECQLHVTPGSTCAQEAMAFGVPTILAGRFGESVFLSELRGGLMWSDCGPGGFDEAVRACLRPTVPGLLQEAAEAYFAGPDVTRTAIDNIRQLVAGR